MIRCEVENADVFVDGKPYRLESFGEIKRLAIFKAYKGIEFRDFAHTWSRLEHKRKKELRENRESKQSSHQKR